MSAPMYSPRFAAVDERPIVDEPVDFTLVGLQPGGRVRLSVECTDAAGVGFASWADYETGATGTVEPRSQAPLAGSYAGVDPHGLWWSMKSEGGETFNLGLDSVVTNLRAAAGWEQIAQARLHRTRLAAGVEMTSVRDDGLVATLFRTSSAPGPPVMVVGGSGGGFLNSLAAAALLGSRGFTAMAVAYFGIEGLPDSLARVPLEYFGPAIRLLGAGESRVGVIGASRGGELALLLGAFYPEVGAVVAAAASGIVWEGFDPETLAPVPAWTLGGAAVPFATLDRRLARAAIAASPASLHDVYLHAMADPDLVARTAIPVEDIRGPVMLISGDDDRLWPSSPLAQIAVDRRRNCGHDFADRHLQYPGAGHVIGRPPGLPTCETFSKHPIDGRLYALGGTPVANAAAAADAWPRVLDFLRLHLGAGAPGR